MEGEHCPLVVFGMRGRREDQNLLLVFGRREVEHEDFSFLIIT